MTPPEGWVKVVKRAWEAGWFDGVPFADFEDGFGRLVKKRDPREMRKRIEELVGPPPSGFRFTWGWRGFRQPDGRRKIMVTIEPIRIGDLR